MKCLRHPTPFKEKMRMELVKNNKSSDNGTCDQDKNTAFNGKLMGIFSFPFFVVLLVALKVVVFLCNEIG